ncbi:MAG: extracellular solute-binding protein [Clostridia bacterium]|nr:extracellular solute-binding protein [Clostridia bacterium]
MKLKKVLSLVLSAVMVTAVCAGCAQKNDDGKTVVSIGYWPDDTWPESYRDLLEGYKTTIETENPDVVIEKDTVNTTDAKIFSAKAAANTLPTMWQSHFTEIQKIINSGYARPITDILEKNGYIDAMNPDLLDLVKGKDGEIYAFPTDCSTMSLTINKELFTKAGLVNEDGSVKIPDTYEEMAEYAKIIKDKTGKAGFGIGTTSNHGGWLFMNIAWSYGVKFMEQQSDGKWKATFNSQETVDALKYLYDLKWKYNAMLDDTVVDRGRLIELFGTGQVGMIIMNPLNDYTQGFNMDPANLVFAKLPKGPAGRYVQMGGDVKMFDKDATDRQVEVCLEFLKLLGHSIDIDDAAIENIKKEAATTIEANGIILPNAAVPVWSNSEKWAKELQAKAEYVNISEEQCKSYFDFSDCTLHVEEPIACQQLYSVLDKCIQEILTNKDADIPSIVETACNDFQVNHLDKE